MKTSAVWAGAAVLAVAVGVHGSCRAEDNASGPRSILGALAGTSVPAAELSGQHARGSQNININTSYTNDTSYTADSGTALSAGALKNNSVIGTSDTGMITVAGSVHDNSGITTVFNNTGNNSLFQQTMTINVMLH